MEEKTSAKNQLLK